MEAQVGRWGNSLAIRIPSAFAREARLEEGTTVDLTVSEGRLIAKRVRRRYTLKELLEGITPENLHPETDWGRPVGKEEW